ncbi:MULTISPECIES: pyridoxal 5'-phosphate synthase glutaminase subunit PdxT [Caloramator]|uniref:Pyridoxal 5'-phosphate synthase subunit PdxT n=1 Tax=Caloramator australicus RC3 TaxID=857293 RepID=G0V493_9CLOT|nr:MULTISPECIES: pyridoxal 5'-phosphate synthase glutaminase subunit PdxT [Caloramator]MDO6354932.1 pyridoxal 5'-phosphate synthase glutaminase subunit PdxT [Caloramator sp. CAR-1]WDU82111.1 pyridoxal 5'-phosphate synthase glutaminase subunit PdxT [Caloramator sp. Dgby_cultured_2]CCC57933.1 Pyridoxine biosynthesis glutamine amidotransferase, glutaminase subunit [Caloramator australicus RC3]
MKIGVLSIQGGVIEHINHLKALGVQTIEVKKKEDLDDIDGIILPGGESTTIGKIISENGIKDKLKKLIKEGLPVWGTCAGMILLAKEIKNDTRRHLEVMDIEVERNAFGSQINSFIENAIINGVSNNPIPLVFIRAPYISRILSDDVTILGSVGGKIVAARQRNMLATAFHPELTDNLEFHKYFLDMCQK